MKYKSKNIFNKIICNLEIFILIFSTIAFTYLISTPEVSAESSIASGCCINGNDGSICQEMNFFDKDMCDGFILGSSCNSIDACQSGCCYNQESGLCSLNSPKQKCLDNNGNWSNSATCNIAQCQLGCCILGDQASITTSRECTNFADDFNFEKKFVALDADGSCDSKTNLDEKGACLTEANDFSGLSDCKFTTKGQCKGEFKKDFLCTSKELNTNCKPSKNTACIEGKDEIYYLDSCSNIANIYDASRYDDESYWNKIISSDNSCSSGNKDCGNCDYATGSRCSEYKAGRDTKATYGDYVCRDLNCDNGKKHGESWCISDYDLNKEAIAPIGSRNFVGICMNGEITIEPCADFNQQICSQTNENGFSEAQCVINEWRSCISANEKDNYEDVKKECDKYEQCIMFSDITGNDKYSGLPGFKESGLNTEQASVGKVGNEMNKVISHCVPKFTGGMVFWNTANTKAKLPGQTTTSEQQTQQDYTGLDYGGNLEETKAICSLGSFSCVSQRKQEGTGLTKDESWKNTECLEWKDPEKFQLFAEGLAERCRSLGPCSMYVNIAGEIGSNSFENSTFTRTNIDEDGKIGKTESIGDKIDLKNYISSLGEKPGLIKAGSLDKLTAAAIQIITGKITESQTDVDTAASQASKDAPDEPMDYMTSGGTLVAAGYGASYVAGASWAHVTFGQSLLGAAAYAAIAAIAGYMVGQIIGKAFGLSNAETQALSYALGAGAGAGVLAASVWSTYIGAGCSAGGIGCIVGLVVAIVVAVFTYAFTYEEQEYWITSFTCEPWSPPEKGDCDLCNNDIRTCSEYRCRSLGLNCKYYNENGEPGYCGESKEIASARISPWQEILTENLKYTNIGDTKFQIESKDSEKVSAYIPINFGIITNDAAKCKIDNKHTDSYDQMAVDMIIDDTVLGCETGKCSNQGTYHKVALSQSLGNSTGTATLGVVEGENNFYIRCKNFAGNINRAEFAVKIIIDSGRDLTPPLITKFVPQSGSYLKQGSNNLSLVFSVNEPSECKYSQNVNSVYEEMPYQAYCITDPSFGYYGQWSCYSILNNLTVGQNNIYIQCQDQPNSENTTYHGEPIRRNINRNSQNYNINVCSTGLNITSLEPVEKIIVGKSPIKLELKTKTSGCVESGKSICSYKFEDSSNYISFINTNSNIHTQIFDSFPAGYHNISVRCEDEAGNYDIKTIAINVSIDDSAPSILRTYTYNKQLVIVTDEEAKCYYNQNSSLACDFDLNIKNNNITIMDSQGKVHKTNWLENKNYYIKCLDNFNNTNNNCAIIIKTY